VLSASNHIFNLINTMDITPFNG